MNSKEFSNKIHDGFIPKSDRRDSATSICKKTLILILIQFARNLALLALLYLPRNFRTKYVFDIMNGLSFNSSELKILIFLLR